MRGVIRSFSPRSMPLARRLVEGSDITYAMMFNSLNSALTLILFAAKDQGEQNQHQGA